MSDGAPAAVVLAAGYGRRLSPLTGLRPKALCPLNNVALVDHAIGFTEKVTSSVAVNAAHMASMMVEHLGDRSHVSVESGEALGTAGAVANLKDWIDGRDVLICNADAWHTADLSAMYETWNKQRPLLLTKPVVGPCDFDGRKFIGASLLPWSIVEELEVTPSGLWEVCWRNFYAKGELDVWDYEGPFYDCGTPIDYLTANLEVSRSDNVVGKGARVDGDIQDCVIWPDVKVHSDEQLRSCIKVTDELTVYVPSGQGRQA